jgi:hypothetical protein
VNSIGEAASVLTPEQIETKEPLAAEYYSFMKRQTNSGHGHRRRRHNQLNQPSFPRSSESEPSTTTTPSQKPASSSIPGYSASIKRIGVEPFHVVYEGDSEEVIVARAKSRIPGKGATVASALTPKKQVSITNASGSKVAPKDTIVPQETAANKIQPTPKRTRPESYKTLPTSSKKMKTAQPTTPSSVKRPVFGSEQTSPLKNKPVKKKADANKRNSGGDGAVFVGCKMRNSELFGNAKGFTKRGVPNYGRSVEKVVIPTNRNSIRYTC